MASKFKIKPIGNKVFVEYEAPPTEKGGIHLPDRNVDRPDVGRVFAAGPEAEGLSVGDTVLLPKLGGQKVIIDGKPYLVFVPGDILCVLQGAS